MSKRVVIVGSGIVGLSTAYYCARRGFDVVLIDRQSAVRSGASFGNAGMIVPSHFIPLAAPGMVAMGLKWMWNPASPFYIKPRLDSNLIDWGLKFWHAANHAHVRRSAPLLRDLSLASRACYEELSVLPGVDFGLVKKGLLMLCRTEAGLHEEAQVARQAIDLGISANILDAAQTAALDPGARMDIAGAVHFPMDCHLSPGKLMDTLQSELMKLGAEFIWDSEVVDFKTDHRQHVDSLVISGGREIQADEFVLCGGAWSPLLARKLALKIPMEAGKGYSLTLPEPTKRPQLCSILTEARVAVTPIGNALRVGGTMEIAGLKEEINRARVKGIIDSFCRYFPEFTPENFENIEPWCGLRPCSPDGLPYVGRTTYDNFSIATGHGMMGISLGPITGRLISEILSGEKPSHDISLLSPLRY